MKCRIMIVSNMPISYWLEKSMAALVRVGELTPLTEVEALQLPKMPLYDLILIESSHVDADVAELVTQLYQAYKKPIVVITAAPNWEDARRVLLAGAADYIQQTFSAEKLIVHCQTALQRFPKGGGTHRNA